MALIWIYAIITLIGASGLNAASVEVTIGGNVIVAEVGPCSDDNAFDLYTGMTLTQCLEQCARRSKCKAISYTRGMTLCVLRASDNMTSSVPEGRHSCYNVAVTNSYLLPLNYACAFRPCDPMSVCTDTSNGGYTCDTVYCPLHTDVDHAHFATSGVTKVGLTTTLLCEKGYSNYGSGRVTCKPNGNFTDIGSFRCIKNCPMIPVKETASFVSKSAHRLVENTTVVYECKVGFYHVSKPEIVCNASGDWSHFECLPACHQSDIPLLDNGYPLSGSSPWYTIHNEVEYACTGGYYLSPGNPNIRCNTSADWSLPSITCYRHCSQPSPANGNVLAEVEEPISEGDTTTFDCITDHYLSTFLSNAIATCRHDGNWKYDAQCYRFCDAPPSLSHADLESISGAAPYTFDVTATYDCDWTYRLYGDGVKTCGPDGSWHGDTYCKCGPCRYELRGICVKVLNVFC